MIYLYFPPGENVIYSVVYLVLSCNFCNISVNLFSFTVCMPATCKTKFMMIITHVLNLSILITSRIFFLLMKIIKSTNLLSYWQIKCRGGPDNKCSIRLGGISGIQQSSISISDIRGFKYYKPTKLLVEDWDIFFVNIWGNSGLCIWTWDSK